MTGKGSVNHNSRKFYAKNTDSERRYLNIEYINENIEDVYHELFNEALARYNEKQSRKDRCIDNYDEVTPHLHIDFVPYTTKSKRGA